MKSFDLSAVALRDSVFAPRQQKTRDYLAAFPIERLTRSFLVNAGLPSDAEPLGGWESPDCGLRGHFTGHFLSAAAKFGAGSHDEVLAGKAREAAGILRSCQREDGWLSAYEESVLDTLERNESFGVWAPYYTLHKILAGLCDCGRLLGDTEATDTALRLALYIARRFEKLSEWKTGGILRPTKTNPQNEFGGIGDALYTLWELTGEKKVFDLAQLFDRPYFLGPLAEDRDVLTDLHANTHLPMIVAAAHRYDLTGEPEIRRAVENFYAFLKKRTFANGNSSSRAEHFYPGELSGLAEHWGSARMDASYLTGKESESCCAYNTEKLLARLVAWKPDVALLDHMEGLKYNALLNSASKETGLSQYEQPMGRGKKKRFSSPFGDFRCCTGSGIETMAALQENLWFGDGDAVFLNQFVSSDLDLPEKETVLSFRGNWPYRGDAEITVRCGHPVTLTLKMKRHRVEDVRCASEGAAIREENGFTVIEGLFRNKDRIEIGIASPVIREPLSDAAPEVIATKIGPILLASVDRADRQDTGNVLPVSCGEDGEEWIPLYETENEVYSVYGTPADGLETP